MTGGISGRQEIGKIDIALIGPAQERTSMNGVILRHGYIVAGVRWIANANVCISRLMEALEK
jgi:hypothetical protein